ncbi:LytTR family DNA-binding domain-containing protein [Phaeobacter sp. B1627]|uniref:LytTR family DNA-binding domain-containing protein n=1 Tax=Phaeobacter sp. B1627 TaxID=2583809 RepID=UPI001118347F|nr:LytTR family DNA-binding domain-containing protein [Phaeobacter sp. B1627]TNJ39151.1 LytTR family transcriptional regulator [Phaeobacter sp. B1627]
MIHPKPSYASDTKNPGNGSPMSLALRQLQATLASPVFWIVVGTAVGLTAMAGPYYTLERLSFPERLVYWGVTIPLSALTMTVLSTVAFRLTKARSLNWVIVTVLVGLVGVLPVTGSVYLSEGIATGFEDGWLDGVSFFRLALFVAPSLIGVTLVVNALFEFRVVGQDSAVLEPPPQSETLLQSKLPHHLGHEIVTVQARDHYAEVTTLKGSAMVLMRLGDAVRDLEPLGGLQVHRSWWVNLAHLARTETGKSGQELVMKTGQRVPVGRSFRKALKEALRE